MCSWRLKGHSNRAHKWTFQNTHVATYCHTLMIKDCLSWTPNIMGINSNVKKLTNIVAYFSEDQGLSRRLYLLPSKFILNWTVQHYCFLIFFIYVWDRHILENYEHNQSQVLQKLKALLFIIVTLKYLFDLLKRSHRNEHFFIICSFI